jgi:trehalose 6-phosphate synthase
MRSFRTLRLSLRFIIPLVIALTILAYAVAPLVGKLTLRWFVRDMDIRSQLIANTLHDPFVELLKQGNKARINALLLNVIRDERLLALGFCNEDGKLLYSTPNFPESLSCSSVTLRDKETGPVFRLPTGSVCRTWPSPSSTCSPLKPPPSLPGRGTC